MKRVSVCGVMVFYDESPTLLMASVTAIAPVLDHLVVIDGAYALFPGSLTQPASPVQQSIAVFEACSATNLSVTLHRPSEPFWGNEVEKRQLSIDLAAQFTEPDEGWYVIFDADQVARKMNVDAVRKRLAESDDLVAEYGVSDYGGVSTPGVTRVRGVYRALPGLQYGPAHYCVSAPMSSGQLLWLWGNPTHHRPYVDGALDLAADLVFDHRRVDRGGERNERARRYYDKRHEMGVEQLVTTYSEGIHGEAVPLSSDKRRT